MEKIATLTGHTFRVLYLAMNPDGSSIVTGAGDETLRFWNIFPKARSSKCGPLGTNGVIGSGNSCLFPGNNDFRWESIILKISYYNTIKKIILNINVEKLSVY